MSHFSVLIITEQNPSEADLSAILAPWYEGNEAANDPKWDWYQIGGRWSGYLQPNYSPETDSRNIETCPICGGTGKRNDYLGQEARRTNPTYTCNGCDGKGERVKWPTQWVDAPGNQCQIKNLTTPVGPTFAVVKDGNWYEKGQMGWFGAVRNAKSEDGWAEEFAAQIKSLPPEAWLTVIDCHI